MFTVVDTDGEEHDVILNADVSTPMGEIANLVASELDGYQRSLHLYVGETLLDPEIGLGDSLLHDGCRVSVGRPDGKSASLSGKPAEGSSLDVQRPSRLTPLTSPLPPKPQEFSYPAPPASVITNDQMATTILSSVMLVGIGIAGSIMLHSGFPLLIPLAAVVLMGIPNVRAHDRFRSYIEARAQTEQQAKSAREDEQAWWDSTYPRPSVLSAIASERRRRLWQRRRSDADYLDLRVGSADRASSVSLSDPRQGNVKKPLEAIRGAATVRLTGCGVLGVVGPTEVSRAACRWLITQVAVLHSPADVRICLLTSSAEQNDWAWARWLPHCRPWRRSNAPVWVGNDSGTAAARISELLELIENRWADDSHEPQSVVVVFDDWRLFHLQSGALQVLSDGPAAGVYAICLETSEHRLPAECGAIVTSNARSRGFSIEQAGGQRADGISQDLVDPAWCECVARALAPLRDVAMLTRNGPPEASHLIDVLRLNPPVPEEIVRRWSTDGSAASAVIGESGSGPFGIDLRGDGPHTLIAGAAGSGKSELLRTIVASLATAIRPDMVTFLLIGYEGGATFRELRDLPHAVGVVADSDLHRGERVLTSLTAELRRRELLLYSANAEDIDAYMLSRNHQPPPQPLPRLVIIVDDFAAVANYRPDFVPALVNIAQRGPALGVHLILATQSLTGVASSPDIRASANLRIALHLRTAEESTDVIDAPDAAFLPGFPGRGYVRAGHRQPSEVQFSLVSEVRSEADTALWLISVNWADLGEPQPRPSSPQPSGSDSVTDLAALVAAIRQANDAELIPAPHRPWLPELPAAVLLGELERPSEDGSGEAPLVPYGLEDLSPDQRQRTAVIDFGSFGHLLAVGDRRTGRSQLLRVIAGSIAATISCADVHIYGIDCGDGVLLPLAGLPHCGAVVTTTQADDTARLVGRLGQELQRRKELLARTHFRTIGDQRAHAPSSERLPHIVVMLDRWESFAAALGDIRNGALTDEIMRLLTDGRPLGIHLVITGDRSALYGRIAALAKDKLIFRLAERDDYEMAGLRASDLPHDIPPGRAFCGDSGTEVQVALFDGELTAAGQEAVLRALADQSQARDSGVPLWQRPFRLDTADLARPGFHVNDTEDHPVGREDVLAWLLDRYTAGGSVALLGPRRAGKTSVLRELRGRLAEAGHRQVRSVLVPLPSSQVETPDQMAKILDDRLQDFGSLARELLNRADHARTTDRLVYLLDEVGRLARYGPAAVSWLRDLGQAGAWLVYTGTEKDWHDVVDWALQAPGSSFGNDVEPYVLGPLDKTEAAIFLTRTAANQRVDLDEEAADRIIQMVGSWPFYLQVVGDAVVRAIQSGAPPPLRELVDSNLLDRQTAVFEGRWTEVGPAGRSALLRNPGHHPADPTPGQRKDLRDVGLLQRGDQWIDDRPFFDWVARNASLLKDRES